MNEQLQSLTQAALLFAAVFALIAIGIALVRKFRDTEKEDDNASSEMMTQFRDLHEQGGLSDEEFRNIKSKLAAKLRTDMRDQPAAQSTKAAGN